MKNRIGSFNTEIVDIGEDTDPLEVIKKLKQASSTKGILHIQPNFVYRLQSTHSNDDPQLNNSWHLKAIQLWDAWNVVNANTATTATVTIGVIDTGIDFDSDDLENKQWSTVNCLDE